MPGAGRLAVRAVFTRGRVLGHVSPEGAWSRQAGSPSCISETVFNNPDKASLFYASPKKRYRATKHPLQQLWLRIKVFAGLQDAGGWRGALISVCLPFSTKPRVSRIAAATCLVSTSPHLPSMLSLYFCSPSWHPVLDLFLWDTPPMPTHKDLVCLLLCNSWAALAFVCVP